MTRIVILGSGTAGTMLANKLRRQLAPKWSITVVDRDNHHDYQPGYLFVPFGKFGPGRVRRPRWDQLAPGITTVEATVTAIQTQQRQVRLADGRTLAYDWLIIATGATVRPDLVEGLTDPQIWGKSAFDFYTLAGATGVQRALAGFTGGRILVHVAEMPIKCPVAPLEFAFLADDYFRRRRIRHKVDLTYVTPLDGAFTKPVSARHLAGLLRDKSIRLVTDFAVAAVDATSRHLSGYDGRSLPFDLLVTTPPHTGADFLTGSPLADAMGFVMVDPATLRSVYDERVFAVGDATNIPTSKAGAVAHFAVDHLVQNLQQAFAGHQLTHRFDGHANCFIETGNGKAMLLDFNYQTEPLPGRFPWPGVGPLRLLRESRLNHVGKMVFEHIYWHLLLPGRALPGIPVTMSMAGKVPASPPRGNDAH